MSEITVTVDAGVCRFKTVIIANVDEEMNITYKIKSECPSVRKLAAQMNEPISLFEIVQGPFAENVIYKKASCLEHAACVIPSALVKAGEAAGDLALKRNVSFDFGD